MSGVTVANITAKGVVDFCLSRGVPSEGLLSAAGIDHLQVEFPGARISAEQVFTLWDEARRLTRDPLIAEHVANILPFGAYRIADYLLMTGATPRDSLEKFIRSFPLVNGAFRLQLVSSRSDAHLELLSRYAPGVASAVYVEFVFTMIFARLRMAAGVDWHPKEVTFTHSSRPGIDGYHPTFGCPVRFNDSVNRMVLEKNFAETPLPSGDALVSEMLDHYGQSLLNHSATDDFLHDVRKVLSDGLSRGDVRIETTARKLALSGRALQRELNGRGTSYRAELDKLRFDMAIDLLTRVDVSEIGRLLQFTDLSSFYRAFRRWTGKTPKEYLNDTKSS